jgi:hypothetical protein
VLEGERGVHDERVEVVRLGLGTQRAAGPARRDQLVVDLPRGPADLQEPPRVRIRLRQEVDRGGLAVQEVAHRGDVVGDPLPGVVQGPGAVDGGVQLGREPRSAAEQLADHIAASVASSPTA